MDKSVTIISRAGSHLRDMGLIIGLLLLLGAVSPCFLWNFFFGLIVFACAIPILVLLGRSAFWSEEVKVADNALTFTTRFLGFRLRRFRLQFENVSKTTDGIQVELNDKIVGVISMSIEIDETILEISDKTTNRTFEIFVNAVSIYEELCETLLLKK